MPKKERLVLERCPGCGRRLMLEPEGKCLTCALDDARQEILDLNVVVEREHRRRMEAEAALRRLSGEVSG